MDSSSPVLSSYSCTLSKLDSNFTSSKESKNYLGFSYEEGTTNPEEIINDTEEYLTNYLTQTNNNNYSFCKNDLNYLPSSNNNTFCPNNYSSTDSANSSSTHGPSFSPHSSTYSPAGNNSNANNSNLPVSNGGGVKRKFEEIQMYPTSQNNPTSSYSNRQSSGADEAQFYQMNHKSTYSALTIPQNDPQVMYHPTQQGLNNKITNNTNLNNKEIEEGKNPRILLDGESCPTKSPTVPISSNSTTGTTARRKNATRESTAILKAWLQEHMKNPYPTKGEKIMLAIITKMTLTQVSTWFANARRRLKKENKMTWIPKNRSEDSMDEQSDTEDFLTTSSDIKESMLKKEDNSDDIDQGSTSEPDLNNDSNNNDRCSLTNLDQIKKDSNTWNQRNESSVYHSIHSTGISSYRNLMEYQNPQESMTHRGFTYDSFQHHLTTSSGHYFNQFNPVFNTLQQDYYYGNFDQNQHTHAQHADSVPSNGSNHEYNTPGYLNSQEDIEKLSTAPWHLSSNNSLRSSNQIIPTQSTSFYDPRIS